MKVIIDRRPIWLLLLFRSFRPLFFLILAALFWFIISLPTPAGLSMEGQRAIAIFLVALALWVSNVIPLVITSLFVIIAVPFFDVLTTRDTYSYFGNEAVFFILGAFILAAAVMQTGLSSRIALVILEKFGTTPRKLLLSIFFLAALLSFVMSEHAVAAMLFPIVLEIAKGLRLKPKKSQYGKLLFLALTWGCIIGGVATFLGGARVPLAVGILQETSGASIEFFEYTLAVLPAVVVMMGVGLFILFRGFSIDIESVDEARKMLEVKNRELGKMRYEEYAVALLLITTIFFWIFYGLDLGLSSISLGSVVVLFLFKLVRWKDVEEYVNWGIILMYGGAITLGAALAKSGAAVWVIDLVLSSWDLKPLTLIAIISLLTIILTEAMSNSAVIAILMPLVAGLAAEYNIDPKIMTYAIAMPAGLAFTLPMATPANAIAVSSGYLNITDMAKVGILASLSAWLVFNLMVRFYWPLIGLGL